MTRAIQDLYRENAADGAEAPEIRSVLAQRQMGPHLVVVAGAGLENPTLSLLKTSFGVTECNSLCYWKGRCSRTWSKLLLLARSRLRSRASLEAETLVLRQQVIVLSRKSLPFVEHHQVVETFAPDRADEALDVTILPR